jgi:hypothetical protein
MGKVLRWVVAAAAVAYAYHSRQRQPGLLNPMVEADQTALPLVDCGADLTGLGDAPDVFIMGASSTGRGNTRATLIAIHTNEGPNPADEFPDRTAENLARWMDGQAVSYHKVVDDDSVVHYVPDDRCSWSLRSGNPRSLNVCFTGYARWSREEWLRHDRMLRQGADIAHEWSRRHNIPLRKLTSAEVGANESGVCGHVNWTVGKRDGSHTDPGEGFPWDVFMRYAANTAPTAPEEDDVTPEQDRMLRAIYDRETRPLDFNNHHGNKTDDQFGHTASIRKELGWLRTQVDRIESLIPKAASGS